LKNPIILILLCLLSTNVSAKKLTLETSNKYLEVTSVKENIIPVMGTTITPMLDAILRGVAINMTKQGLSQEKVASAVAAMRPHVMASKDALIKGLETVMPFSRLQEEIYYPVLSESFSEEELSEIIDFLKTPVGKKFSSESVAVFQKASKMTVTKFGPAIEKFFSNEMAKRREQAISDMTAAIDGAKQ